MSTQKPKAGFEAQRDRVAQVIPQTIPVSIPESGRPYKEIAVGIGLVLLCVMSIILADRPIRPKYHPRRCRTATKVKGQILALDFLDGWLSGWDWAGFLVTDAGSLDADKAALRGDRDIATRRGR
jgi:hypothetical protein